jgi:hypothetical protein
MLSAHFGVDSGPRIAHDRERPADLLAARAAVQVRDSAAIGLLEDLDAVAAERRRNPLAVQDFPGDGLARQRRR